MRKFFLEKTSCSELLARWPRTMLRRDALSSLRVSFAIKVHVGSGLWIELGTKLFMHDKKHINTCFILSSRSTVFCHTPSKDQEQRWTTLFLHRRRAGIWEVSFLPFCWLSLGVGGVFALFVYFAPVHLFECNKWHLSRSTVLATWPCTSSACVRGRPRKKKEEKLGKSGLFLMAEAVPTQAYVMIRKS